VERLKQTDDEGFDPTLQDDGPDAGLTREPRDRDDEPDVLLDVPELRVDEISLDVEDLRARVALHADVLSLLRLHVGVEAELGRVQLTIKGVEAQALLKVRLDNVARIIDRVLTTIDNNPEIVEGLIEQVGATAEELDTGSAVEETGRAAGTAVGAVGKGAETASEEVAQGAGQVVDEVVEEPRQKRARGGKPRKSAQRAAEGRGRGSKAVSTAKKRPTKGSRRAPDRRSKEG
jgi:hypothetical protein